MPQYVINNTLFGIHFFSENIYSKSLLEMSKCDVSEMGYKFTNAARLAVVTILLLCLYL